VKVPFLELGRETEEVHAPVSRALEEALRESRFTLGPAVGASELAWASFCGAGHAVGVASGTDALALALGAVGVGPGDEVVTAANTCVPTVAAIVQAGAAPVLADVDPRTGTLDPASAASAVTERTRAIVPVHLYGQCAEMEPILAVARARGLSVVEDAAQAHGAEYRGRRAGTLADAAAFSFYPTKNLGALGDAGAVVTDDGEVAERVRLARSYGESTRYLSVTRAASSRLDTVQAAVLAAKLPRLAPWNERRRSLAGTYLERLAGTDLELPAEAPDRRHVYHLFPVRTPRRDALRRALEALGVETLVHYPRPVHKHPAYADLARSDGALSVSERLSAETLSLPLYPQLRDEEQSAVCEAVLRASS